MKRHIRRGGLPAAALLPVLALAVACSGTGGPAGAGEDAGRTPAASEAGDRSAPLTAGGLKAALLTEAEAEAAGFTVTGGGARTGAAADDADGDATEPAACAALREVRSEEAPGRGESAAAWSMMYGRDGAGALRKTVLTSYPAKTARSRVAELRRAVDSCDRFSVRNPYGAASFTTETLPVPDLGEEVVRYRLLGRTQTTAGDKGYAYSLVTAVRVGGVIATVETSELLGPLPPARLAEFEPEPGPDEPMIAALVEKVSGSAGG
ncbi:hypothetical protein [Streptomyces prasinopilosus]|uniref:PknH-like extracellular domain-containing protein n=1 Tax=Streptomyces prasinopilosus TaxID=67344 RepID=A0A1G6ZVH2_9ACTN|nr:hypothetical protein [Streptomyces prasinopilosus]SDE06529.1 hypothetical protein SAMN05216505_11648 [Streptomyces prasinopilosus]